MKNKISIAINSELLIHSQNTNRLCLSKDHYRLKNDLVHFEQIIDNKLKYNIEVILLDRVAREDKTDNKYSTLYKKIINSIDDRVNLSRCPMILPFIIPSKAQEEREKKYRDIGNYGDRHKNGDAVVIADAVNAKCDYLLVVDYRLLSKEKIITEAIKDGLVVLSPTDFIQKVINK